MAKISQWPTWEDMSRDMSRAFYKLTVGENFVESEFSFRAYQPHAVGPSTMPVARTTNLIGRYYDLGNLVHVTIGGNLDIAAGGVAGPFIYLSLPLPYDPVIEGVYRFNTWVLYTLGPFSYAPYGELYGNQWIRLGLIDSTTGAGGTHGVGDTASLWVRGFYEKAPQHRRTSDPIPPNEITV